MVLLCISALHKLEISLLKITCNNYYFFFYFEDCASKSGAIGFDESLRMVFIIITMW